jgi:hypothetical protein
LKFKEFFLKQYSDGTGQKKLAQSNENFQLQIANTVNSIGSVNESDKLTLTTSLVSIVNEDKLIDEIDKKLPPPLPGESKEKFVNRALGILDKILDAILK